MDSTQNSLEVNTEQIKNMYAEASSPKCWKKIIQKTQPTNSLKMWQSLDIYV